MPTILIDPTDFSELFGSAVTEVMLSQHLDLVKGEYKGPDENQLWRVELNDTNRPDLWTAEGIARQIRMVLGRRRDYPFFTGSTSLEIRVDGALRPIRPFVGAFVAKGLKVTDRSLRQLIQTQEKLAEIFGRKRKDVAIGVYNVQKITFPVHYLAVDPREVAYTPLGMDQPMKLSEILEKHPKGIEYRGVLAGHDRVPLLRDSAGMILSMPPIINSRELGEVVPGDSDLFVEATATELSSLMLSLNILACDLADRGARITRIKTVFPYDTPLGREVELPRRPDRSIGIEVDKFTKLLGVKVKPREAADILERYGCDVKVEDAVLFVSPPPTRLDYLHWVDVVEDYAIARGYETFTPQMPRDFSIGRSHPLSRLEDKVRDHLIGLGYEETIANILVGHAPLREKMGLTGEPLVEVDNVMNESYSVLRNRVLPSLLTVEARSGDAVYPHRLFECGEVAVFDEKSPQGSRTELHLGALVAHGEITLSEIHSDLEFLGIQLGQPFTLQESDHPWLLPGRSATVLCQGTPIGWMGELHPAVLDRWEIGMPAAAFELNLNALS